MTLDTKMNQQFLDLGARVDALSQILIQGQAQSDRHSNEPPAYSEKNAYESENIEAVQVFLSTRSTCRDWCPCACHAKRKVNVTTPKIMENVLGRLFVGYAGLPMLNNPCDFRGCKDRQDANATVEYWLPWWFVTMNMKLQLKLIPSAGPQVQLSTTRRVPDSSQSITFAMKGDIEGLKYLFTTGSAGPRDVSNSRGYSLLRVCVPQRPDS